MTTSTLFYIILAAIAALLVAIFHYFFRRKNSSKKKIVFAFLRFITVFGVLLLLINPKFKQRSYYIEKAQLVIAIDNSSSVKTLGAVDNASQILSDIKNNETINERFDIDVYSFGKELQVGDSLSFTDSQTNISKALSALGTIYKEKVAPTVLISDGNQTFGNDYQYTSKKYKDAVFPVVLGDTATYEDIKIQQLNVNKYAYLNNKFPVEAIAVYQGERIVDAEFSIRSGSRLLHKEKVRFSPEERSKIFQVEIAANRVGVQTLSASILGLSNEKNTENNRKFFAVEVIDQKTNIAIVSSIKHPDIGAIKRSLEANKQRSLQVLSPAEALKDIKDYQMVIIFQPDASFSQLFSVLKKEQKNSWIIAGSKTNWNFLNRVQQTFRKQNTGQTEEVQPIWNSNYNTFISEDIGFGGFPPVKTAFGDISFNTAHDVLLYKQIGNVATKKPLLTTFEIDGQRTALLLGEDIWRWRAQNFLDSQSFEEFDSFLGKIVQYLASNKRKQRLNISYESFYYGNGDIKISAQYFDKNYVFDDRGSLQIRVKNKTTDKLSTIPMLLRNNYYQADLSSFPAGDYSFTVVVEGEKLSRSGNFTIVAFDVEKQFLNADIAKLKQLAINTSGTVYNNKEIGSLISQLNADQRFTPIQKSREKIVPLIDWKWLLGIIAISLALEWFLRKYNGLI